MSSRRPASTSSCARIPLTTFRWRRLRSSATDSSSGLNTGSGRFGMADSMPHRSLPAVALCAILTGVLSHAQTRTDEYTRYELQPPGTGAVKIVYEASAITEGARTFTDGIAATARVSDVVVRDMMTGEPLKFVVGARSIAVTL